LGAAETPGRAAGLAAAAIRGLRARGARLAAPALGFLVLHWAAVRGAGLLTGRLEGLAGSGADLALHTLAETGPSAWFLAVYLGLAGGARGAAALRPSLRPLLRAAGVMWGLGLLAALGSGWFAAFGSGAPVERYVAAALVAAGAGALALRLSPAAAAAALDRPLGAGAMWAGLRGRFGSFALALAGVAAPLLALAAAANAAAARLGPAGDPRLAEAISPLWCGLYMLAATLALAAMLAAAVGAERG
jgi:hypothetical protein